MQKTLSLITFAALLTIGISAQEKNTKNTLRIDKATKGEKASPEIMNFLEGSWVGKGLGGEVRETWQRTGNGDMMGMFIMSKNGEPNFYEFILITVEKDELVVKLKHFTPELVGWEEKEKSVNFRFIKRQGNRYFFNGLTFENSGPDQLRIYVALRQQDGSLQEAPFVFSRELKTSNGITKALKD